MEKSTVPSPDDGSNSNRQWNLLLYEHDDSDFEAVTQSRNYGPLHDDNVEIVSRPPLFDLRKKKETTKPAVVEKPPFLLEDFEDDFSIITKKPTVFNKKMLKSTNSVVLDFSKTEAQVALGASLIVMLFLWVMWKRKLNVCKQKVSQGRQPSTVAAGEGSRSNNVAAAMGSASSNATTTSEDSHPGASSSQAPGSLQKKRKADHDQVVHSPNKLQRHEGQSSSHQEDPKKSPYLAPLRPIPLEHDTTSLQQEAPGVDGSHESEHSISTIKSPPASESNSDQPITDEVEHADAPQLHPDIKHLQMAFEQLNIGSTMAQQLALTLHCSQSLFTRDDGHSKGQESSHWDPDWKDKLRNRRDRCWDAACRLIFDLTLAHTMVSSVKPIIKLILNGDDSYLSSVQVLQLGLSKFCNCDGKSRTLDSEDHTTTWAYLVSPSGLFWQFCGWDSMLAFEQGFCYTLCLLRIGVVLIGALIFHQVLRAFSFPGVMHHATNALAISIAYRGPSVLQLIIRIRPEILILISASFVAVLGIIQWSYLSMHKMVKNTNNFRKTWDDCIDAMDDLQSRIVVTRYAALSMIAYLLWSSAQQSDALISRDTTAVALAT
mmetsp:Transcript_112490/g.324989  ORF Transcript_112490/g.324989 Transcript_112490/m.324989 type:complete len:602 (+) Transcript_112490:117-1922(+)